MSLRGAIFAPWQSRGSAHVNKVTLLCIAMLTESHGFIAMTILYCLKCFNCKSSLFCPVYYDAFDRMTTHVRISPTQTQLNLALHVNKVYYYC